MSTLAITTAHEDCLHLLDEKQLSDTDDWSPSPSVESSDKLGTHTPALYAVSALRALPCASSLFKIGFFLLPSFVQSALVHDGRVGRTERLAPTSYLDGMRGLAALFVFFCHYFYTCFIIAEGWGWSDYNYQIWKLPFIRLLYSGPPMVCIFFVISGYALSLKPLTLIRSRKYEDLQKVLSSFVFRRAIRLFLPAACSTFMVAVLIQLGAYEQTKDFAYDSTYMKNVQETHGADRQNSMLAQVMDWAGHMFRFVHVWSWANYAGSTAYDVHLWTVPVEFRSSMVLFLTLMGLARLRTSARFWILGGIALFVYLSSRWEMLLFYAGMALAEMDVIRGAHSNPATTACISTSLPLQQQDGAKSLTSALNIAPGDLNVVVDSTRLRRRKSWIYGLLSILALYLLSSPDLHIDETPGYITLSKLIPTWWEEKYRFWHTFGAILFVFCVARSPAWQRFFNRPSIQYLGKISYALYLVHGPILHTVGYVIERQVWGVTGTEGLWYNAGFWIASLAVVPCVIWAADVFWRLVDAPTVRFAKWFETRCIVTET